MLLRSLIIIAFVVGFMGDGRAQDATVTTALNVLAQCDRHEVPQRDGSQNVWEHGWEDCTEIQMATIRLFDALQAGRPPDQADVAFMAQKAEEVSGRR